MTTMMIKKKRSPALPEVGGLSVVDCAEKPSKESP